MFNQFSSLDFLPITSELYDDSAELETLNILPPSTYEEWLEYNSIETWPIDPEDVNHKSWLDINVGTLDELRCEVKKKAPCQVDILDDILQEILLLEGKVNEYSECVFTEKFKK